MISSNILIILTIQTFNVIIIHFLRFTRPYNLQIFTFILYIMINNNFYKQLGLNIKKKREILGLTQQELADKTSISLNHIGKIEVAFSKPSLETVLKIATALNITVSDLCNFKDIS